MSTKLLDLSEKIQTIRLNELRAKRENEELEERINYITRLLKNSKEQVATLEESASKYEGQMIKQEEEFRKRDNERLKQFFYVNRFEDPTQKVDVG